MPGLTITMSDHHHVGSLREVERHFAERFVAVCRVHLIAVLGAFAEVAG